MAQAAFPDDVLPPEGIYDSRHSLTDINSWEKSRGYEFTTGKSIKTPNGRVRVIFACDRNKQPPSASIEQKRYTCSRRTGCKFSVLANSLAYLRAYPDLLFLDCTYKTNKYEMPLLDTIGVDACQRTFCIAFAFLSGETEEDYIWALDRFRSTYELCRTRLPSIILTDRCIACMNAVSLCFPSGVSLLCLWHANKAALRYCQPTFVRHQQGSEAYQQGLSD